MKKTRKTPRSRAESKQETKQALVRAALELFAKDGLDASLDAICDRAGFTRGAFYVHFRDREDLLVAVMNEIGQTFLAGVFASAPKEQESFRAAAKRFVRAVGEGTYPLMGGDPGAALVRPHQLLDACARSPKIRASYRSLVELAAGHVATLVRGEKSALAKRVDADDFGMLALALVIGAQTMMELGMPVAPRVARAFFALVE